MPADLNSFLTAVEFDKIKELIAFHCIGSEGRQLALQLTPQTNLSEILQLHHCQKEIALLKAAGMPLIIHQYRPLEQEVFHLHIEDYVLDIDSFITIRYLLENHLALSKRLDQDIQKFAPVLHQTIHNIPHKTHLLQEINRVIDPHGQVKPDASPELSAIKKKIKAKEAALDKVFRELLQKFRQSNLLTEQEESVRNGRRVFSIASESKRKISGIIHDQSATGKTLFIEPDELIQINNDIFSLHNEEKYEIYRVLKTLSAYFRAEESYLKDLQDLIAFIDLQLAIAQLSAKYQGTIPKIEDKPLFKWYGARHPLLFLKNQSSGSETVPFDLDLHPPNRIIILSGPNAGGKSITMKALGLIQVMIQAGIPVPMAEHSSMGIFTHFFADVGDQQSLEDDLSTYSAHLTNMRDILRQADQRSLLIIDEFGAGTDPKIGGAIAEALLKAFNQKKIWGLVTTHYGNLKLFAFKEKGLVNAAMHFDQNSLKPTYKFQLGKPGSSYAFEIARKSNIPEEIIQFAKKRAVEKESDMDEMLIDIQTNQQELNQKLAALKEKEKSLNLAMQQLEQARNDLDIRRKKWKLEVKEFQQQQNEREIKQLENLIKEFKKNENLASAQATLENKKRKRPELQQQLDQLKEEIIYQPASSLTKDLREGMYVKLIQGSTIGKIQSIQDKYAIVIMGDLSIKIPLKELVPAETPIERKRQHSVQLDTTQRNAHFQPKIDIRGLIREDAMRMLENFLDQAALSSATRLEIIHGKGDGILKKAVRQKLKEYKFVQKIFHPDPLQGGDGITLVDIA